MPLRWWPVAHSKPVERAGADDGDVVGGEGRNPTRELLDLELEDAGDELARVAQ